MLCGPLQDRSELEPYLLNDRYVLEEKFNGTRKEVMKDGDVLSITNKRGQATGKGMLPATQAEFLKVSFDFTLDTEDEPVGGGCVLLDILTLRGKPLDRLSHAERRKVLEAFYKASRSTAKLSGWPRKPLDRKPSGHSSNGWRLKTPRVSSSKIMMFVTSAEAGRAYQFKYKFQATASVIVDEVLVGGKRSIGMVLLDGGKRVSVGKCAIPVNKEIPAKGSIAEIRYLFAEGGSNKLNQPFYLGPRDDIDPKECKLSQLKYKPQSSGK